MYDFFIQIHFKLEFGRVQSNQGNECTKITKFIHSLNEYHFHIRRIYYVYTFWFRGDIMHSEEHLETKINQSKGVDYMSTVTAQKWGNSLGIRIPKDAAHRIGIDQGSEMVLNVIVSENIITLKPKKTQKKYTLQELLSQITPENRHKEIDFGIEGRELF